MLYRDAMKLTEEVEAWKRGDGEIITLREGGT